MRKQTTSVDWALNSPIQNMFHRIVLARKLGAACASNRVTIKMLAKCRAWGMTPLGVA